MPMFCSYSRTSVLSFIYYFCRGTGIVASSSTFQPHLGRVIKDLLHVVLHSAEALDYSNIQGKLQIPHVWP